MLPGCRYAGDCSCEGLEHSALSQLLEEHRMSLLTELMSGEVRTRPVESLNVVYSLV